MRAAAALILCLHLLLPIGALAQASAPQARQPLFSEPLYEWGAVLAIVMFGGLASWVGKVKKGAVPMHSAFHLIGELTVAAFAGLLVFLLCKWAQTGEYLTPAASGMAGYMGGRAIEMLERAFEKKAKRMLDIESGAIPLDKPINRKD